MANERALSRTPLVVTTKSILSLHNLFFPPPNTVYNLQPTKVPYTKLYASTPTRVAFFLRTWNLPCDPAICNCEQSITVAFVVFSSPSTVYTHPVHPSRHYQRVVATFARCVSRATMCVASHCKSHMRADGAGSHSEAFFFQKNIRPRSTQKSTRLPLRLPVHTMSHHTPREC